MVKVYLDPGHGGSDPGAVGNGLLEKNLTLDIAKRVHDGLLNRYENVSVKMSRTTDKAVSLGARADDANRWGADLFISIHINSGGGTGFEDYIHPNASKKTVSYRDAFHKEFIKHVSLRNRGRKTANFQVLRDTQMPAILTENGFIDRVNDANKLKKSSFLDDLALGHIEGIAKSLNLRPKENQNNDEEGNEKDDSTFLIRVITPDLYYYNKPDWDAKVGKVQKGEVFTVVDTLTVNGSKMYKLKSGNYITAYSGYVEII
ncbi:N-acetylmuramoyl-L-alanine amidase [Peribacillus asahii]|uniref:N-acetylmuramoyl-L-alanine amidase n=1 Tax=Peribacillus asahii TaxID=228899 RepID=UPI002079B62C|nr:N-acetylmuramoyl-L-alanine amidase [Peribacillus asahii]USK59297.1 N-acetylmuramoyl-L-alanine amidase [Peribacillus asahii]